MAQESRPRDTEADQWSGRMGERWRDHADQFESMIRDVGMAVIDKAGFKPGEHVIDIGCGGGPTSLEIARRVGPQGSVTGLDISPALVELATARAKRAGIGNVQFDLGDASKANLKDKFDRLFSRFGVMFFEDPHAAFAHMRGFLKPGGSLIFACWGPLDQNPWMKTMMDLTRRYMPPPAEPPKPAAPGPFAFGDPDYVRDILQSAGFSAIKIEPWRGYQYLGGRGASPEAAGAFFLDAMPLGDALKELPKKAQDELRAELIATLRRYHTKEGVRTESLVWFVSARA